MIIEVLRACRALMPAGAVWVEFRALTGGERPQFDPGHPLGCHRRRIPGRVVFEITPAEIHYNLTGSVHGRPYPTPSPTVTGGGGRP